MIYLILLYAREMGSPEHTEHHIDILGTKQIIMIKGMGLYATIYMNLTHLFQHFSSMKVYV